MSRDINIGDIWKWIPSKESGFEPEYWLISDFAIDGWLGICLQDYDPAEGQQEITVDDPFNTWIKVG